MRSTWKKRILTAAVCGALLLSGCARDAVGETEQTGGAAAAETVTGYVRPADFTVSTADGWSFSLSGAVAENDAVLIVLFDPSDPGALPVLSAAEQFCAGADRVAGLGLTVGNSAAPDGSGLPVGSADGTGLERLTEGGLPVLLTVDRYGYLAMVNRDPPVDAEELERLTAPFLGEDYVLPEESRYEITMSLPVPGVIFAFCTDETCVPAATDGTGTAVFEGAPGEYEVKVLSVPQGYEVSLPEGLMTGPYAERIPADISEAGS